MKTKICIMKFMISLTFLSLSLTLFCQVPVHSYSIQSKAPVFDVNSAVGWSPSSPPFNSSTFFQMKYGLQNQGTAGVEKEVSVFTISSGVSAGTYVPEFDSTGKLFDTVIVKRVNNNVVTGNRSIDLFEKGSYTSANHTLYLQPSYLAGMERLLNTTVVNRGTENVFSNTGISANNIERIDLIFPRGIGANATELSKVGILLNELGGNDNMKVAAIRRLDSLKQVTELGPLKSISQSDWGRVGPQINTTVLASDQSDPFLRPRQNNSMQKISGVFVSLAMLGVSPDSLIRGISIFPADVNIGNDLIGLSDVPKNTNSGSNGGLDLMGGAGFFREVRTSVILPLHFLNFNCYVSVDDQPKLVWTASNDNREAGNFFPEISGDGVNWVSMGRVNETGPSGNAQYYVFNVQSQLSQSNYFRIKYLSVQGAVLYSHVKLYIPRNSVNGFKISYPAGSQQIQLNSGAYHGQVMVHVLSIDGRLLQTAHLNLQQETTTFFTLDRIPAAQFIVQVLDDDHTLVSRIFIR